VFANLVAIPGVHAVETSEVDAEALCRDPASLTLCVTQSAHNVHIANVRSNPARGMCATTDRGGVAALEIITADAI
jgi:hypothetical protein